MVNIGLLSTTKNSNKKDDRRKFISIGDMQVLASAKLIEPHEYLKEFPDGTIHLKYMGVSYDKSVFVSFCIRKNTLIIYLNRGVFITARPELKLSKHIALCVKYLNLEKAVLCQMSSGAGPYQFDILKAEVLKRGVHLENYINFTYEKIYELDRYYIPTKLVDFCFYG